ncbi:MAG: aconitase X [Hyphomicrobiaceae bacterium]
MHLTEQERAIAAGADGAAIAMRIVAETGRLLGADRLIPIRSAHIDGCLYHGNAGVTFAERLAALGTRTAVPATLNVGALDLMHAGRSRLDGSRRAMALRQMRAYEALGCAPTWTCAPYQAGHRPAPGTDVAWGESNAVAFCNSVLGARTNRYGDFLDIACAIIGQAPRYGLHLPENRYARIVIDASGLSPRLRALDAFWPVLGAIVGRNVGDTVAALTGLQSFTTEDRLKALGASAASFGAVGLFHVVGVTPEAATLEHALGHATQPESTLTLTPQLVCEARNWLSTAVGNHVDAVAVGSPHLSFDEMSRLVRLIGGRRLKLPFYAHTGRRVLGDLQAQGFDAGLREAGATIVTDTCIVVTPILPEPAGVLLTNSGKFAHYAPGNTGWAVLYGSSEECVETAVAGRLVQSDNAWT